MTEKGDTVGILFGGRIPHILRNESDFNWDLRGPKEALHQGVRLIGECYIQSLMQGEIEQMVNRREVSSEILEIT